MARSCPNRLSKRKTYDRKCECFIDPDRGHVIKQMFEKVAYEKWSGRKIYHWLKFDLNFKTAGGNKNLSLGNIYKILESTFYYGVFEYPTKVVTGIKENTNHLLPKNFMMRLKNNLKATN
jgi:hypothetical protein